MRRFLLPIIGLLALLEPVSASAFQLDLHLGPVCRLIPCYSSGGGMAGLNQYLFGILTAMELLFVAVALVMVFLNAANMVLYSTNESTVGESRSGLYYNIIGAALVALSHLIVQTFAVGNGGAFVNPAPFASGITLIVNYVKALLAVAVLANVVIQGIRFVTAQGEDAQVEKARKRLFASFIGTAVILLANVIVSALVPGSNSPILNPEIVGIAQFFLTLVGAFSVIAIVAAGIMLVVSVDESLKDKAKSAIKTSIVALIVVIASFAIVTTFL
ncbi:MAG: hypothetical protein Greene041619_1217 [Candidatus Peregrinibacteria bacterium Greene0416_19]|nr:MAG: hypothetical protein Greene041619_1217 [Candidatus Peregrinibacteria bacterium Greene0416_19]